MQDRYCSIEYKGSYAQHRIINDVDQYVIPLFNQYLQFITVLTNVNRFPLSKASRMCYALLYGTLLIKTFAF